MPRMRTIDASLSQLHQEDSGCCLTKYALRKMVLSGMVPHIMCGNKYMLNFDALLEVLAGRIPAAKATPETGGIRRVV